MDRRTFVSALVTAPLAGWAGTLLAKTLQFPKQGQASRQFPGGIRPGPPLPSGPPAMPPPPKINPHAVLRENQKNIKKKVGQLYELAAKLRKQVNHTDSSKVLSLNMIHTAEEIEKLAKQIRDLARG